MSRYAQPYGQYGALQSDDFPQGPRGYSPPSMREAMLGEGGPAELPPPFATGKRRRLNVTAVWTAIFAPWVIFVAVYAMLSLPVHFEFPGLAYFVILLCLIVALSVGCVAYSSKVERLNGLGGEPTWLAFLAMSLLASWLLGFALGAINYMAHMLPYQQLAHLNTYVDVHPAVATGKSFMDAGIIRFDNSSRLDMTKVMSFKNSDLYCVAPVMAGDLQPGEQQVAWDFWAVGTNCCSGEPNDWRCGHGRSPQTHSAMRLMPSSERPYYRLAVQQAEAMFKIRSNHPLFFHWVDDPATEMEAWRMAAYRDFRAGLVSYLVFQCFLVAVGLIAFSKLGYA